MSRPFATKLYKSKAWQGVRKYILMRDKYLCQKCKIAPAEEVHHIVHLNESNINNPMVALHESGLIALCRDCHFKEHKHKPSDDVGVAYEFDENGYVIESNSK
ncbi:MAG: HNH endonuclease [Eubacteriales bacterium]|nr:HNH endonuclease [Eubacteriales bacterium]